jgi:hypothetical protein
MVDEDAKLFAVLVEKEGDTAPVYLHGLAARGESLK